MNEANDSFVDDGALIHLPGEPPVFIPPEAGAPIVSIQMAAWNALWSHARTSVEAEVGGILVGKITLPDEKTFSLEVAGCLPATAARSERASVLFTAQSWEDMKTQRLAQFPHLQVVGWYHTHPGFGVFLSRQDYSLHNLAFDFYPWCVALVVDPVKDQMACFWPTSRGVFQCLVRNSPS